MLVHKCIHKMVSKNSLKCNSLQMMILYTESTKTLPETIPINKNNLIRVAGYKVNIQKSVAYLY